MMHANAAEWLQMFATACMAGGGFAAVYYPIHIHLAKQRKSRISVEMGAIVKDAITEHEERLEKRLDQDSERIAKRFLDNDTKLDERFDANDRKTEAIAARTDKVSTDLQNLRVDFARETGGNGGGIRQAVNAISSELSTLNGAFNQHLRENARGDDHHKDGL